MPVILAQKRQENHKFEDSMGYKVSSGQSGIHSKSLSQRKLERKRGSWGKRGKERRVEGEKT